MLTLFSYPDLYGVADNNPYGLKVYAFLKLCKLAFRHEHILDTKNAPRGQFEFGRRGTIETSQLRRPGRQAGCYPGVSIDHLDP